MLLYLTLNWYHSIIKVSLCMYCKRKSIPHCSISMYVIMVTGGCWRESLRLYLQAIQDCQDPMTHKPPNQPTLINYQQNYCCFFGSIGLREFQALVHWRHAVSKAYIP